MVSHIACYSAIESVCQSLICSFTALASHSASYSASCSGLQSEERFCQFLSAFYSPFICHVKHLYSSVLWSAYMLYNSALHDCLLLSCLVLYYVLIRSEYPLQYSTIPYCKRSIRCVLYRSVLYYIVPNWSVWYRTLLNHTHYIVVYYIYSYFFWCHYSLFIDFRVRCWLCPTAWWSEIGGSTSLWWSLWSVRWT